jgi:hypothetical protein
MRVKICLLLAVLLTAVFSVSIVGQTNAKFVSQDGGFAIDLPREGYQGVEPVGDLNSGSGTYAWVTEDGQFSVSYVEGAFPMRTATESLNTLADVILKSPANQRSILISRRQFVADGNPVIELRIKRPQGLAINRLVLVKRRLFVITADWADGDGNDASVILDSFKIVDSRSLVA